jgi:hypothetical protein
MASRALAGIARRPARIAVSYAAAGGPHSSHMTATLQAIFGSAQVTPFTVRGEARAMPERAARAIVEDADLVFLGGGDPVQGARLLAAAGADAWLRAARARGTPCMGLSAGAMMLCAWWAAWPESPDPESPEGRAPHDGGTLVACTGVVPDLVVDCHAEEDGWAELTIVHAMLAEAAGAGGKGAVTGPLRFLGLPSGSGVVVVSSGASGASQASQASQASRILENVGQTPYVISDWVGRR